jgi:hypothetical protein
LFVSRTPDRDDAVSMPASPTIARTHDNLVQNANVVRVLVMSLLAVGIAGGVVTVIVGFQDHSAIAVVSGLGGLLLVVLTASVLLLLANWALAWSATTLR